jgi:hypothetical protein
MYVPKVFSTSRVAKKLKFGMCIEVVIKPMGKFKKTKQITGRLINED